MIHLWKNDLLYSYILKGKNRNNITKIKFKDHLINIFLEFFIKDYIDKIRNLNMNCLQAIIINDNKILFLKPKDFSDIQELYDEEINILKRRVKDLNLLFIDFRNDKKTLSIFEYNYLSMNIDEIKEVYIYNIGNKKNYDTNCYYLIKNKKPEISCKKLEKIIYQNKIFNVYNSKDVEQIKTLIDLLIYKEKYLYYSSEVSLNDRNSNEMTFQYLIFNIWEFNDLVPSYAHKNNMEIYLKLYKRNIILEFISSKGKVYLRIGEKFPLEYYSYQIELILKNIIPKFQI